MIRYAKNCHVGSPFVGADDNDAGHHQNLETREADHLSIMGF